MKDDPEVVIGRWIDKLGKDAANVVAEDAELCRLLHHELPKLVRHCSSLRMMLWYCRTWVEDPKVDTGELSSLQARDAFYEKYEQMVDFAGKLGGGA